MQRFWSRLSNIGVIDTLDYSEQKKVRLLNQSTLASLMAQFVLIINGLLDWSYSQFILYGLFLLNLSFLFFNYKQFFFLSKILFNLIYPIVMAVVIIAYGDGIRGEYAFFFFAVTAVIFYKRFWKQAMFILLNFGLYVLTRIYIENYDSPLAAEVDYIDPFIVFLSALLSIAFLINMFARENFQYVEQTEDLLKAINKKNEDLNMAYNDLERFTYAASHDLKTPLRSIISFIGLMERKVKSKNIDELEEYMLFVKNSARQMHVLIMDILEYSSLNQELEQKEIDLNELIEGIKFNLETIYSDKKIDIQWPDLPKVWGSQVHYTLLFQNLLENGVKYNNQKVAKILIVFNPLAKCVTFEFKDNGLGIAPEYQEKIFEMFKRLHNVQEYAGTGIGLAICKKITDNLNGEIWVESVPEHGSSFFVRLPRKILMK